MSVHNFRRKMKKTLRNIAGGRARTQEVKIKCENLREFTSRRIIFVAPKEQFSPKPTRNFCDAGNRTEQRRMRPHLTKWNIRFDYRPGIFQLLVDEGDSLAGE